MRHLGVAAFGLTVCVLTPMISPHAGPAAQAKLFASGDREITVNGATVKVSIDHPVVGAGESVHLTLTSDKDVTLGLVMFGTNGTEGQRVPSPPLGLAHVTASVKAGVPKDVALRLAGAVTQDYNVFGDYTIYVASTKAASHLATLRDRGGPPIDPPSGEGIPDTDADTVALLNVTYAIRSGEAPENPHEAKMFAPGTIARLEAYTRPKPGAISLVVPDTATTGHAFVASITVTNPLATPVSGLEVRLTAPNVGDDYLGLPDGSIAVDPPVTLELAPHESRTFTMKVAAATHGVVGLRASIECDSECDGKQLTGSTFDAVEIIDAQVPDPTPTPIAVR